MICSERKRKIFHPQCQWMKTTAETEDRVLFVGKYVC
jgi:hypothetical protein